MPTLTKAGRRVQVPDNDASLLAYYVGDGWSEDAVEQAEQLPEVQSVDAGSLDLGDQDDDTADDTDDHPKPGPGDAGV